MELQITSLESDQTESVSVTKLTPLTSLKNIVKQKVMPYVQSESGKINMKHVAEQTLNDEKQTRLMKTSLKVGRQDFKDLIASYTDSRSAKTSFSSIAFEALDTSTRKFRIELNGTVFLLPYGICQKIPSLQNLLAVAAPMSSRKRMLTSSSGGLKTNNADDSIVELNFDRDPTVFSSIVDYARNNELHVPKDVCRKVFARDLTFWGFSIQEVAPCCFADVVNFLYEQDKLMDFQWFLYRGSNTQQTGSSSGESIQTKSNLRARVWRILDEPFTGSASKIYFFSLCVVLAMSFVLIALSTTNTYMEHLPEHEQKLNSSADNVLRHDDREYGFHNFVIITEYICAVFLFLDYLLRIIFYPNLRRFFMDLINITDGLAMITLVVKYAWDPDIDAVGTEWFMVLDFLQLLRMLRVLRPMSQLTWFRLMYFTVRCSSYDLMLVIAMLLFLAMVCSSLLFYVDDKTVITSIPIALWYSLITMTTVGYGDIVPQTVLAKLIGSVLAVLGVIIMTMTTPIMVSNFHSLYINAIVGMPSTLKKLHSQLFKANLCQSLDSDDANLQDARTGSIARRSTGTRRSWLGKRSVRKKKISIRPKPFYDISMSIENILEENSEFRKEESPGHPSNHSLPKIQTTAHLLNVPGEASSSKDISPVVMSASADQMPEGRLRRLGAPLRPPLEKIFRFRKRSGNPEATSSAEDVNKKRSTTSDKDSGTTSANEESQTWTHLSSDLNQNMKRNRKKKNRALRKYRYRSRYARHRSTDTDSTDDECSDSSGHAGLMDFPFHFEGSSVKSGRVSRSPATNSLTRQR